MAVKRLVMVGVVFCLAAGAIRAAEEVPRGLSLSGVPEKLVIPPPEGTNVVLTAKAEVPVRSVWLARNRDSQARYLLAPVGAGVYQLNLGDPEAAAILAAAGAGNFRVFAEKPDGELLSSVLVSYAVEDGARFPWEQRAAPLPQVYVHTKAGVANVRLWHETFPFAEHLALRAEAAGQGVTVWPAEITPEGYLAHGIVAAYWFRPDDVERIEVRFSPAARQTSAEARLGVQTWPFALEGRSRSLRLTPEMRKAWQQGETLAVAFSQGGQDEMRVELKAPPEKLDLPEPASVTIIQRNSKPLPGSRGYLTLSIDDITGGQVLVTVRSGDGQAFIDQRSMRQGETATFEFNGAQYALTIEKMVNLLIGDDWAVFSISAGPSDPQLAKERRRIDSLIQAIGRGDATFLRGGVEYSPGRAMVHIRQKYDFVYSEVRTLDSFIDHVGGVSWGTGEEYRVRLPDGKTVKATEWLRTMAARLEAEAAQASAAQTAK